jgi:hypothetical protein
MSDAILDVRRRALEDSFFREQDRLLVRRLTDQHAHRVERENISSITGITDPALIDQLIALDLRPPTLAALALVPLVVVAWADGDVTDPERLAVLAAAADVGLTQATEAHAVLDSWLRHPPPPALFPAWEAYTAAFVRKLDAAGRGALRDEVMTRARAVARAQGGFLMLGRIFCKRPACPALF